MVSRALTVSQLNFYIRSVIDSDEILRSVLIRGEVSNFTYYRKSGHMYFTLKDGQSAIKAVMFRSDAEKLSFMPEDGMSVIASARVSVFERDGVYQLYVSDMTPDGLGKQMAAFLQLKEKLEKEGLFAAERKKPLPPYPKKIAVASSPSGAALQDILSVTERRWSLADIEVYPCVVQGAGSAESVIKALEYFNKKGDADIIIVARGGGAYEDLASFNDEGLARAVAASNIPVISAVGHETDFTVIDFAADLRAPTPSAAAELAVPASDELSNYVKAFRFTAEKTLSDIISNRENTLLSLKKRLDIKGFIQNKELIFDRTESLMQKAAESVVNNKTHTLAAKIASLRALDPLGVLARGYAVVYKSGKPVLSAKEAEKDDKLTIKMKDGEINCVAE